MRLSSAPGSVDEAATVGVSAPSPVAGGAKTPVGATVSRYVVLEEIGRGGMGRVLRTYDPKLQREVALKEVRPELLDAEATRRLVAEARAMAKLSHPNVVAVYDVEPLDPERIVLAMEYVAGQTLREWLREQDRPWRDIVDRFLAAGRGLVAAHEAGLLHRDFKPANVLVGESSHGNLDFGAREGHEQVKVTDFGLAKPGASTPDLASSVEHPPSEDRTEAGTIQGTPRYMAPEQHRGEKLGTAADQYAFCVSLWEALCGTPPFAGKTIAEDKLSGPPSWPAVYRSAHSLRSGAQGSTPRPIVDAVVRGLSPRPDDRWPTMGALLEALSWEPDRARHRWMVGAASVGLVGLAAVSWNAWNEARAQRCRGAEQQLAGVWDQARSANVQAAVLGSGKAYAEDAWTRTKRELDGYAADWAAMHTEACEATAVRGEQSPQLLDLRMGCLQRAAQDLRATVDTLADADDKVVHNAHKLTGGLRSLSRCGDAEALAAEVEPPLPEEADAVKAARRELAKAKSLGRAGRYEEAREAVEAAKVVLVGVDYGPVQTEVALHEGTVLKRLGDYAASQAILSEALELASQWGQWDQMAAAASDLIFVVGYKQRRMDEALRYRPLVEGLSRGQPVAEASARHNVAVVLQTQGNYEEAEREIRAAMSLWEEALGPDHPRLGKLRNSLARILVAQGNYEEAEAEFTTALSLLENALGSAHPEAVSPRNNLASVLGEQGKYGEAEVQFRRVVSAWEAALGPDHPDVATSRSNLAGVLLLQRRYEEAEAQTRMALEVRQKTLGPEHPDVAGSRESLAVALREQGKYEQAEVELRAALSIQLEALGPDHRSVAMSRHNLASTLERLGRNEEAEAEHRIALSIREKAMDPDHPRVAMSRASLADVLLELDRAAEALPLAEQAWARQQRDDTPADTRGYAYFVLARALWSVEAPERDRTRARQLADDALRLYRQAGEAESDSVREVQRWLDEHPRP